MPILPNYKGLVNNSLSQGKAQYNSFSKDKLLLNGENPDDILFFLEEKIENIPINSSIIIYDIEKKKNTWPSQNSFITIPMDMVISKSPQSPFIQE